MTDFIDTDTAELFRINDEIIGLKFKTEIQVELEDAKQIDAGFMEIIQEKDHFFIIDATDIMSNMDNEASRYFSKESKVANYTRAAAIVLNSLPIRLTASFFIKFQKPRFPTRIFDSREKAIEWFEELKSKG